MRFSSPNSHSFDCNFSFQMGAQVNQLKSIISQFDAIPTTLTAGKVKPPYNLSRFRPQSSALLPWITLWSFLFLCIVLLFFFISPPSCRGFQTYADSPSESGSGSASGSGSGHATAISSQGANFLLRVRASARPGSKSGFSVLVTGAAGFVGSHVSLALKRRGDGVVGLDNYNAYYSVGLKRARKNLLERSGVFIVEGDLNDVVLLRKLFDSVAFTHVMHLAAQAGVRYAMQNPKSYISSNVAGFVSLLEAARAAEPQPVIVWASSSSVYGLNSKVPFSEKDRTDQPASLYAASKKAGEGIAHVYNHIHGLSITGLRFFTVYGPWGRPDMAYYFFTKDILKGKEIKIFEGANHGSVARDFTYIDDVVKGCLAAVDTAEKSTGSGGEKKGPAQFRIYNLGNTSPVSVGKLVSILEKLLKVKAKKKVMPLPRNGDVQFTHANISLAQKELGYKPTTDLEMGLKKFVKWYLGYHGGKKKTVSSAL